MRTALAGRRWNSAPGVGPTRIESHRLLLVQGHQGKISGSIARWVVRVGTWKHDTVFLQGQEGFRAVRLVSFECLRFDLVLRIFCLNLRVRHLGKSLQTKQGKFVLVNLLVLGACLSVVVPEEEEAP